MMICKHYIQKLCGSQLTAVVNCFYVLMQVAEHFMPKRPKSSRNKSPTHILPKHDG